MSIPRKKERLKDKRDDEVGQEGEEVTRSDRTDE